MAARANVNHLGTQPPPSIQTLSTAVSRFSMLDQNGNVRICDGIFSGEMPWRQQDGSFPFSCKTRCSSGWYLSWTLHMRWSPFQACLGPTNEACYSRTIGFSFTCPKIQAARQSYRLPCCGTRAADAAMHPTVYLLSSRKRTTVQL